MSGLCDTDFYYKESLGIGFWERVIWEGNLKELTLKNTSIYQMGVSAASAFAKTDWSREVMR